MEKSPNSKKSPEKKSGEVDQKKLSATQSAMKWLKDNWRKSTILGVGAIMAAPGVAQDANKQATREFTDSKGNTVEIAIKNKKGETKKQDYQATAEDFENAAKDSKTKESKKERVKPQQEIDLTWPSLDPELVEKYGIYYDEIGRVLNEDGTTYKGEYGAPFIGGATKEKVAVVNNGPRKLKPGYKFGPNNVVVDSKGNPATEDPFVRK
ncbi:hypothetical protein SDC9_21699 [bioreactor metagenome]|uniref:Uncharacterized protein n=1 Tax=bioreactor metagenome TaxID=1076179 RepID=A0A644UA68_9ZZZZ|nr:hypothetical protein [Candidatus Elulimicrobiales bacterium]